MDFSKYREYLEVREGGFKWTGSLEVLKAFFSDLGYKGKWSRLENHKGSPHRFEGSDGLVCLWYEKTKTLQIQGNTSKSSELKDKLGQIMVDPILAAAKVETETESTALEAEGLEEDNEFNEDGIHDGLNPGKVIRKLLDFKMKKWSKEGAKVTIATPFMDEYGLKFIKSCLYSETALDRLYTREVCGWNKKKIKQVIVEAELSEHWIGNKVVAFKKRSFHAKFLTGEYKDKVELIVTSCNMTSEHLDSDQLETVMRTECPVKTFRRDYWLEPLEKMAEGKGSVFKFANLDDINQGVQKMEVSTPGATSPCD